ncbi:hypothetical protein [Shinella sedimenti]|uniref:Transposase n=1 Tax=Shinella sedimenti TaxID=2919913 RepID=A0ABT0CHV1_9HYPH|nr:hypothetical protein [Shinella sedimenti]MCJ8148192.1 hypothetical protein [Shinella sedimenti]
MADVVRLTEWAGRTPRRDHVRPAEPAQVLLFTGVRYERLAPVLPAPRGKTAKHGGPDTARRT